MFGNYSNLTLLSTLRADSDIQAPQNQIDLWLKIQERQTWFHLHNWNITIDFIANIELILC